jgi:uncharacterized surface protein with fasciclin (FAS1) repeats
MSTKLFAAAAVAAALVCGTAARSADKDIVDTAVGADGFKTLVTAVKAADLVETLKGKGPFTVFAPTDEAFKKLGDDTIKAVLADKEKLKKILLAHVVEGKVLAADVAGLDGKEVKTVGGAKFTVSTKDGVMIGNAKVVKTDILASNGVIHVIDTVLIPKE